MTTARSQTGTLWIFNCYNHVHSIVYAMGRPTIYNFTGSKVGCNMKLTHLRQRTKHIWCQNIAQHLYRTSYQSFTKIFQHIVTFIIIWSSHFLTVISHLWSWCLFFVQSLPLECYCSITSTSSSSIFCDWTELTINSIYYFTSAQHWKGLIPLLILPISNISSFVPLWVICCLVPPDMVSVIVYASGYGQCCCLASRYGLCCFSIASMYGRCWPFCPPLT
jgi:hypothetical protein